MSGAESSTNQNSNQTSQTQAPTIEVETKKPNASSEKKNIQKKKKMYLCSIKCTVFLISVTLVVLGVVFLIIWQNIYNRIIISELSLKDEKTRQFQFWKETPIPMFFEIYLFNWTNADKFVNGKKWTSKPKFQELGPYVFEEHHSRTNIKFNDNFTISFNTIKTWHFVPEKSNGSLDDNITTLNTIALTVGNMVKHKSILIRKGVSFIFDEQHIPFIETKTAREFLFDGYNDTLLNILKKLNMKGVNIPFDKFGWFVTRNGSSSYDGNFTMNTGADDIQKLGIITRWNQSPTVPNYYGVCARVNGTTGELWYPVKDAQKITIFTPDTCSTLTLEANGSISIYGVEGNMYEQTPRLFDNGTKYPEMKCFSPGESLPSGVRNVSQCKFGAPVFMSMPHFYQADPSYRNAVDGMNPNPDIHNFYLALEPNTGLPLKVHATLQVSLYLSNIDGIGMFENVKSTMMPVLWFRQHAAITEDLADLTKTLLVLPTVSVCTSYGFIACGVLLIVVAMYITLRQKWQRTEDEEPLTQNHI